LKLDNRINFLMPSIPLYRWKNQC